MGVMTDYLKSKQRKSTERCPVRPGGVSVQGGDLGGDGGVWNPTGSTIPHTSQPQF